MPDFRIPGFGSKIPATAGQAVQSTKAADGAKSVGAVGDKTPLFVGFGPSQKHGAVNDKVFQMLHASFDAVDITMADGKQRGRRGEVGVRPRGKEDAVRPFEDPNLLPVPTKDVVKARKLGLNAFFDSPGRARRKPEDVLKMWASTTHAHLWTTEAGKAMAHFGVHRYGQASVQFDQRGKLEHVVEVLGNADRISLDQQAHGASLDPKWREYLEYAALLHDIGYMNGGWLHPKKGGNDMMYHLREQLRGFGVDDAAISNAEIEKMALVVELHGDAFPWNMIGDDQDARRLSPGRGGGSFGDFPYLSLQAVDEIFAQPGRVKQFVDIMKKENEVYMAENPGALAWLDDPAQVKELIHTGYVMHAADKYKGPTESMIDARTKATPGVSAPLMSVAECDEYLRRLDIERTVGAFTGALNDAFSAMLEAEPDRSARMTLQQKVLPHVEDALQLISSLADSALRDSSDRPPKEIAQSLASIADTRAVRDLDATVSQLPKKAQDIVKAAAQKVFGDDVKTLGGAVQRAIDITASHIEKL